MVRKHTVHWSVRSTRSRPNTPAPKGGWVITDLSRITGIPVRRIRYYVDQDFIRPLEKRGTATRYPRQDLLRLLAIEHVRSQKTWKLDTLKRELDRLGEAELERLVTSKPLTPEAAAALGIQPTALTNLSRHAALPLAQSTTQDGANSLLPSGNNAVELWHHVELLPGLKLLLSSKASAAVRGVANKICDEFLVANA
jgi:DNA-binding transcriptional MerR regulator